MKCKSYEELKEELKSPHGGIECEHAYLEGIDSAISYLSFRGYTDLADDMMKELYERKKKLVGRKAPLPFLPSDPLLGIYHSAQMLEALTQNMFAYYIQYFLIDSDLTPRQIEGERIQHLLKEPGFSSRIISIIGPREAIERLDIDLNANRKTKRTFLFGYSVECCDEEAEKEAEEEYWEEVKAWKENLMEGRVGDIEEVKEE